MKKQLGYLSLQRCHVAMFHIDAFLCNKQTQNYSTGPVQTY